MAIGESTDKTKILEDNQQNPPLKQQGLPPIPDFKKKAGEGESEEDKAKRLKAEASATAEAERLAKEKKGDDKPIELTQDNVLAYINKDRENPFESYDDVFKPIEVEKVVEKEILKEVNPYEDLMSEDDKAYFKYKKETRRGRKEYDFLKKDIKSMDALELAREKARVDSGMNLSNAEADEYLETALSIGDLKEMEIADKVSLNKYVKPYRDTLLENQEKYKAPKELEKQRKEDEVEMVELENGKKMPKAQYDQLVLQQENHKKYLTSLEKGVNSVTSLDIQVEIDKDVEFQISYELTKEEKHSMFSDASDVDKLIVERFKTKDGFNHTELALTLWRGKPENFNKIIATAVKDAVASTKEAMIKNKKNSSFTRKPIEKAVESIYGGVDEMIGKKSGGTGMIGG